MADVSAWAAECQSEHGVFVRFIWSRGAGPRDWKVTAQAYSVVDGRALVKAEVYVCWPSRACKTPEALMMNCLIQLEHALDLPLIGASAGAILPPAAE